MRHAFARDAGKRASYVGGVSLPALPPVFQRWFEARGWALRPHQAALIDAAQAGEDALLIAPTGAGKTLAGFLPSLLALAQRRAGENRRDHALHTLYVSPLKALATDIARNLAAPVREMGLDVTIETRTGDTPAAKRARQRVRPPDILLTTPEQLMLLVGSDRPDLFFADVSAVIVDEAHALAPVKRGDMLSLCLGALQGWAPGLRRTGLSATVEDEAALAAWIGPAGRPARIVKGAPGAAPQVDVLLSEERIPWSGHTGRHAMGEVYQAIKGARTALVFVNTRFQAELAFQELWRLNEDGLPIALHHGSLEVEQRRKVEAAMASGKLRAIVCTSTLDLGIDWGDVDLVIQLGAPKGASRLMQRIGRSNHRLDAASRALLVPTNRFEMLECRAAQAAVAAGAQDGAGPREGALDVLAQFIMGRACGAPASPDQIFAEATSAGPYASLPRALFDRTLSFVRDGGYALATYDRFARLGLGRDGLLYPRSREQVQRWRMNVGAIIENPTLKVRLSTPRRDPNGAARAGGGRSGRVLGEIEEYFIETLAPRDTFLFAGEVLRLEGVSEGEALVSRAPGVDPKIPTWAGGKFPLSTFLAEGVRAMIQDQAGWPDLHPQLGEWLAMQRLKSAIPKAGELLVETFARGARRYLCAYPFEGRLAHQTLGMLLTRRLERMGAQPLGFVANDYALAIWGLEPLDRIDLDALFDEDMLGDDLDAWLAESMLMKRTFRYCAIIGGLIERRFPGQEKTSRQVTFSTDLIYDVLRTHEPDHVLLQAAWADAGAGLLDIHRLGALLKRIKGRLKPMHLARVSPFAVPLLLEIGKESVTGDGAEAILEDASLDLVAEAMGA